ncbi:unnamed protein product [Lactuca saligna]|uniref:PQ-loop repeat family protein / transmembrane family protein n=1 Tax=Lactuca saligna TaxID=75948 RepID=A0AA36EIS0_LACSI|nr:unnamed protein product [Lactuca saligna]
MELLKSNMPMCPADEHCSQWARNYMKYCLCTRKDWISLILGLISVMSWGVAEVPQIITNYKQKSSEGLAMCFLLTWILGDLFNVFGCLLEPATLPTQYYMAVLYLVTTLALTSQALYYGYFCHQNTSKRQDHKIESVDKKIRCNLEESTAPMLSKPTPSLPIPAADYDSAPERVYYTSARSLTRSHTPTNFFQRATTPISISTCDQGSVQEPLLLGKSTPASQPKTMLCVVFTVAVFLYTSNLKLERNSYLESTSVKPHEGFVIQVGRKLLQVSGSLLEGNERSTQSIGIGTFLGWGMAAIYMGGRLPQIFLNIRRGHVQGLNPLMFVFALVGNSTYVASILVNSLEWSKIHPNLPWVVEASGCVMLDTFILIQFIYFRYRKNRSIDTRHRELDP